MIDDAKVKAKQNSVNGLMEAVNMTYTTSQLTTTPLSLPIIATIENGVITIPDENNNPIKVEYTGEQPISGKIVMDLDGNLTAVSVKYSDNSICSMGKGDSGCTQTILTLPEMVDDPNEDTRKIFQGGTPNNYISLKEGNDDVLYRIVAIETDGTIKVVRQNLVTTKPYDPRTGTEPYDGPRLNSENTYCKRWNGSAYSDIEGTYYGCNAWSKVGGIYTNGSHSGTVTQDASLNTYLNEEFYNTLAESTKKVIVNHEFKLTSSSHNSTTGTGKSISQLYETNPNTWIGKIGLIELRDYFNASSDAGCIPETSGGYYKPGAENSTYKCKDNNYLYPAKITDTGSFTSWWTLSPYTSSSHNVFNVNSSGSVGYGGAGSTTLGIRPVFYLTSNISLTGNGSPENPYRIKN